MEACAVFAASMDNGAALGRMAMLSGEYRERWEMGRGPGAKAATGKARSLPVSARLIASFFAMPLYIFWIIAKPTESAAGTPPWAPCIREAEFLRALLVPIRPGPCPDTGRIPAAEPGKGGDGGAPRARARVRVYVRARRPA